MINRKTETAVGVFILIALGVFLYMTFQLGAWRVDGKSYSTYYISFKDVAGLERKGDVKIAGVKVGWIDDIYLQPDQRQACVKIMLLKSYSLYEDAISFIRQDGLLGSKYLELAPGSPRTSLLKTNSFLVVPTNNESLSLDTLINKANSVVNHVEGVTRSFNQAFTSSQNVDTLQNVVEKLSETAAHLATITSTLNQVLESHHKTIISVLNDTSEVVCCLKKEMPILTEKISTLADTINTRVAPKFEEDVERVSTCIDRNLHKATESFVAASDQISEVAQKINQGAGVLGQLVNDTQGYDDIKMTVQKVKNTLCNIGNIRVIFDPHLETLCAFSPINHIKGYKEYFDVRLFPTAHYMYLVGLVCRQLGGLDIPHVNSSVEGFSSVGCSTDLWFDRWLWDLQFGKIFGPLTFRAGLFESTFGFGIDYTLSFFDSCRLISTFEAYDFRGTLRCFNDHRPYLKWINRLFVTPHFYFVLGANDFISRDNKSALFGAGLRFSDEDLRCFFDSINGSDNS